MSHYDRIPSGFQVRIDLLANCFDNVEWNHFLRRRSNNQRLSAMKKLLCAFIHRLSLWVFPSEYSIGGRWSRPVRGALLLTFVMTSGGTLCAGPWLNPEVQVFSSAAIAKVRVDLNDNSVSFIEWIMADPEEKPVSVNWLGLCLPDITLLHKWVDGHPNHPGLRLWQRAIQQGSYTSLIFLRNSEGELKPFCEAEAMLARGWESHPDYSGYLNSVLLTIAKRPKDS